MRKTRAASGFFALAAACLAAGAAGAAATDWHRAEGGGIRLRTAGRADASGNLRGALEIALKPGWKTYWRDPGTAGVPPSIDVSGSTNVSSADLSFPVPQRHDDGYGAWAGYSAPVTLPVTFSLSQPGAPALIEASVFLGMCREICVPVSARFSLDASPDAATGGEDSAVVDAAFAALPEAAGASFSVEVDAVEGNMLRLSAHLPVGATADEPELFVAGENGAAFGVPVPERTQAGWRFSVPLLDRPSTPDLPVFFTLSAGKRVASGTFLLP